MQQPHYFSEKKQDHSKIINGWCSLRILQVKCENGTATGNKSKEKKQLGSVRRLYITLNSNEWKITDSSTGKIFNKEHKLYVEDLLGKDAGEGRTLFKTKNLILLSVEWNKVGSESVQVNKWTVI
jgi:hypothetical protein